MTQEAKEPLQSSSQKPYETKIVVFKMEKKRLLTVFMRDAQNKIKTEVNSTFVFGRFED
jgi:hypothetical protein